MSKRPNNRELYELFTQTVKNDDPSFDDFREAAIKAGLTHDKFLYAYREIITHEIELLKSKWFVPVIKQELQLIAELTRKKADLLNDIDQNYDEIIELDQKITRREVALKSLSADLNEATIQIKQWLQQEYHE